VDAALFDKTGTLTKGEPQLREVVAVDGDEDRLLRRAAAVEADSEHPLAQAIVAEARARSEGGDLPQASDFQSMTGRGVQARVEGTPMAVGGRRCCASWSWPRRRCWPIRSAGGSSAAPPSYT
jgi:Cu2+-exporting ATPase